MISLNLAKNISFFVEKAKITRKIRRVARKGKRTIHVGRFSVSQELIEDLKKKGYEVITDDYLKDTWYGIFEPIHIKW